MSIRYWLKQSTDIKTCVKENKTLDQESLDTGKTWKMPGKDWQMSRVELFLIRHWM